MARILKPGPYPQWVWYQDDWWQVVSVIRPTKYDEYILVQRRYGISAHEDGSTPIEMALISAQEEHFVWDGPKARSFIGRLQAAQQKRRKAEAGIQERLTALWLAAFKETKTSESRRRP